MAESMAKKLPALLNNQVITRFVWYLVYANQDFVVTTVSQYNSKIYDGGRPDLYCSPKKCQELNT